MIEGKRYAVDDNTLLVFKPAQIHHVQASGSQPYEYFSIMCGDGLHSVIIETIANSAGFFTFKNADAVYQRFLEFNRQNGNMEQSLSATDRMTVMNDFLESVLDDAKKNTHPTILSEDPIISTAVSYIEDNVYGIARLDQICDAVGVSKEKLYGLFIRNMLISPMKYVRAKKVALAKTARVDE